MVARGSKHPAIDYILDRADAPPTASDATDGTTTSQSLARALAVGCVSRMDSGLTDVSIWDPAAGSGYAGAMLVQALESAGVRVRYRGQETNRHAVAAARERFESFADAVVAHADTLADDEFPDFRADLVLVDAPWGMGWGSSASEVHSRHEAGEFSFGLPQTTDATWLFISLAIEKLRSPTEGGGRVAALVAPSALSSGGAAAEVRRAIVERGMLESVTRLPEGLAPNTSAPLYLVTFTNSTGRTAQSRAMIADLQSQFIREGRGRALPVAALEELESGLRTGRPGPRNRLIAPREFTRRDVRLAKTSSDGRELSWRLAIFNDTRIDAGFLEARYGPASGVSIYDGPKATVDLDPSRHFSDDAREIIRDLERKGWPTQRLSRLLAREPVPWTGGEESADGDIFVPTFEGGSVSTAMSHEDASGRVLSIRLDGDSIDAGFLASWLNSEQGLASRRWAIESGSTGVHVRALRSDRGSLMRWADELIIPVPSRDLQLALASADQRLASFQAELGTRRAGIWANPDSVDSVVSGVASAFDNSLTAWLEQLPSPIATALWAAEAAHTPGEMQLAYIHAWEAIVTFHATVLLSAARNLPGEGSEVQTAIRKTLEQHRLGIDKATLGTWIVIAEKTSSVVRSALESSDRDEIARVRRAFADLGEPGISRLVSKEVISKFNELNAKRNRWNGHSGYVTAEGRQQQVDVLIADLNELRQFLGDVWSQLTLVRAGSAERRREGFSQAVEVALGTKSPFRRGLFWVGDAMVSGELYLVKDGSQSPLPLLQFVQLKPAPQDAHYTTYFYNRTEGELVRLVSYQHGTKGELTEDVATLRHDFGELADA